MAPNIPLGPPYVACGPHDANRAGPQQGECLWKDNLSSDKSYTKIHILFCKRLTVKHVTSYFVSTYSSDTENFVHRLRSWFKFSVRISRTHFKCIGLFYTSLGKCVFFSKNCFNIQFRKYVLVFCSPAWNILIYTRRITKFQIKYFI